MQRPGGKCTLNSGSRGLGLSRRSGLIVLCCVFSKELYSDSASLRPRAYFSKAPETFRVFKAILG